jgi:two-component system sensor histidine kinase AlgZ
MQGPFSSRRGGLLFLLVWLLLGLVLSVLVVGSTDANWTNGLLFAIPVTMVYGFAAGYSAYYLCRAYPLSEKSAVNILAVFIFTALTSGASWAVLSMGWNALLKLVESEWAGVETSPSLTILVFGLGVVLYGLSAVANYLAIEFDKARAAERRELESKLMAQEAELRMLRTQIDPHFLFNSLNSISALTSQNPAGARAMTLQLADFFRHSLGLEAHTKVTLAAEAKLVNHFLAIEQVRFGARLASEQTLDEEALPCLLPPMILQPLVENAVKHGIGNLTEGGTIHVRAQRTGSVLRIVVENDIDEDMVAKPGAGIGLANVRQRLATAYGHEASVHWTRDENKFRVELTLPAETKEP